MRLLFFSSLTIVLLVHTLPMSAQDIKDPRTGSGKSFGIYYTSMDYQKDDEQDMDHRIRDQIRQRTVDQAAIKYKKERRVVQLKFYNYSDYSAGQFASKVEEQLKALYRDFAVEAEKYGYIIEDYERGKESTYQLVQFEAIQGDYRPSRKKWEHWRSFSIEKESNPSEISVFVVSGLPAKLGHGYARYAWQRSKGLSDIIIRQEDFGFGKFPFHEGKVLTHLLGNFFGLDPLTGMHRCKDDGIDDTPIHDVALYDCPEKKLPWVSTCDYKEMTTDNFMANTPDICRSTFTIGQWRKMLATISALSLQK